MNFLSRSIKGAFNFFKDAVFAEEIASSPGILQRTDPRLKMLVFLTLIVLTCFLRSIPQLLVFYSVSILFAVLSGISIPFFIKRVWFFIPIFTLFIAIPAVFMYGVKSAVIFILRVATCVSFAVLMAITTKHSMLLRALRYFLIPNIFVQILDMTYRYIFFFVKVFEEMHMGLKSRLIKKFDGRQARKWIGSRIGYLFKRSIKMSEDVYMAMLARGYTGEIKKYGR